MGIPGAIEPGLPSGQLPPTPQERRPIPPEALALGACLVILGTLTAGWYLFSDEREKAADSRGVTAAQDVLLLTMEGPRPGEQGVFSIYAVRPDGSEKTLIVPDAGTPSWTPDGRIIYVSDPGRRGRQIWIADADGSNARQVGQLSPEIEPLMPQLGEDGTIVFMGSDELSAPEENQGIYVMREDGSGLRVLTRGMQPFLARSGAWIAYTYQTNDPYHRQIWRINTDGTGQKQLTFLGDPDYPDANAASISPDEEWIAFFSGKESDKMTENPNQPITTWGHRNVAIIPSEGGKRITLTPCRPVTSEAELRAASQEKDRCIAADNPAWSPDGEWLIFDIGLVNGAGTATWRVDRDGGNFGPFYPVGRGIVRVPLI